MVKPIFFDTHYMDAVNLVMNAHRMSESLGTPLIIAFSGGKDSQALYHLAKNLNVPFVAKHMFTTWEQPELIRFIRERYHDVIHQKQPLTMWQLIEKHRFLPSRWVRYCCSYFKEMKEPGCVVMTGVRKSESVSRSKRLPLEYSPLSRDKRYGLSMSEIAEKAKVNSMVQCVHGKDEILTHPLFSWSENDVKYYLSEVCRVPLCPVYSMGYKRAGCVLCPLATYKDRIMDAKMYPKYYQKLRRVIQKLVESGDFLAEYDLTVDQHLDIYMKGLPFKKWYAENVVQLSLFDEDSMI